MASDRPPHTVSKKPNGNGNEPQDGIVAAGEALVLLAAGGSGGHMFPAAALAGELLARGRAVALVTDDRGLALNTRLPDVTVYRIKAANPSGGLAGKVRGAWRLFHGMVDARRIVKRQRPSVVVGFGGYASVPTVMAATARSLPVVLHEQNAVLGRANRMLAGRVRAIATGFPTVSHVAAADRAKLTHTGNPIRSAVKDLAGRAYVAPRPDEPLSLLVLGGSQGATVLSQVIPRAVALLPEDKRNRLGIAQQCRQEDIDAVRAAYKVLGLHPELATFFGDAPHRLARCHLAITRAGASTLAELTAVGVPALLVPYPHAMDDHQTVNVRSLSDAGAAEILRQVPDGAMRNGDGPWFTPTDLADRLSALIDDPAPLVARAAAAASLGRADAAARLADLVEDFLPERVANEERSRADSKPGEAA